MTKAPALALLLALAAGALSPDAKATKIEPAKKKAERPATDRRNARR